MPLFVGDYLRDTARLKAQEHGAYLLLLMDMWNHEGLLTDKPSVMAAIARVDRKAWPRVWEKLEPLFYRSEGGWRQKRLQIEVENAATKSAKRAAAGVLGGHRKALKTKGSDKANASGNSGNSQANARKNPSKRGSMPEPEPYKASYASSGERASASIYDQVFEALGPSVADPETCAHTAAVDQWLALGADPQLIVDTVRLVTAFERDRPIRKLHAITPEIRKSMEAATPAQTTEAPPQTEFWELPDGEAGKAMLAVIDRKGQAWAQAWLEKAEWNGTEVYVRDEYARGRVDLEVGRLLAGFGYDRIVVRSPQNSAGGA
jgi:uncharacterized protein YdaU (DUF1376 family)